MGNITDSSTEQYTDTTGINLGQFILETLNRNTKDRMLLLRIEQELVTLAKDKRFVFIDVFLFSFNSHKTHLQKTKTLT